MNKPSFVKTDNDLTDRNFQELVKVFKKFSDFASAAPLLTVALAVGDNAIAPNIANPQGRIITFQDAASNLFDKSMVDGKWVINSSSACTIKLTFF